jgi:hypothetical protein
MKAFTFKRYGKSPALGFDDVDYPTPRLMNFWLKFTPLA